MNERIEEQRDIQTERFILRMSTDKLKILTFSNATVEVIYIFFLCLKMLMNAARLNIITVHLMLTVLIYLALLNAIANLDTQEMAWIVLVGFLNLS